jgi:hypothetical protein
VKVAQASPFGRIVYDKSLDIFVSIPMASNPGGVPQLFPVSIMHAADFVAVTDTVIPVTTQAITGDPAPTVNLELPGFGPVYNKVQYDEFLKGSWSVATTNANTWFLAHEFVG